MEKKTEEENAVSVKNIILLSFYIFDKINFILSVVFEGINEFHGEKKRREHVILGFVSSMVVVVYVIMCNFLPFDHKKKIV